MKNTELLLASALSLITSGASIPDLAKYGFVDIVQASTAIRGAAL